MVFNLCETRFLRLCYEYELKVFENWVLRGVYGPNGEEVTGERRKLRSEELHDLAPVPCFKGCQVEEV